MSTATDPGIDFLTSYADAVRRKDHDAFARLYASDVRLFDTWDQWSLQGRQAMANLAQVWFGSLGEDSVGVTFAEVRSQIGGELGYLSANACFAARNPAGERLRGMSNRFTVVLAKASTGWSAIHQHSSVPIPFGAAFVAPPAASGA